MLKRRGSPVDYVVLLRGTLTVPRLIPATEQVRRPGAPSSLFLDTVSLPG
jgi:hypothetical protein